MNTFQNDIPGHFVPFKGLQHTRREVMIEMRDGVKLFTVIVLPRGANGAPMVLDRTPYGASKWTQLNPTASAALAMYAIHGELLEAGYVIVLQDIRGKYKSEGEYVLNRPLCGTLNETEVDHATDAYDTIDWLANNVGESNGRVATLGISYDGFTTLMSLINPHNALKAAVPINPMVDNWIGDDWFHNGAFRQLLAAPYLYAQTASKSSDIPWPRLGTDAYEIWLRAGNASNMAAMVGLDQLPAWQRMVAHPSYDEYWQAQAVDRQLRSQTPRVPTLHVRSQWDAEDSYGPIAAYTALTQNEEGEALNRLVIGPWSHPGVGMSEGCSLGRLRFGSDTARWFRRHILLPFLDAHLRQGQDNDQLPRVCTFETGSNRWRSHDRWPPEHVCTRMLYTQASGKLGFEPPTTQERIFDEYESDPAKPVPFQPRPVCIKGTPGSTWDEWLVEDQRFADGRTDVLSYFSEPLDTPLHIAGSAVAHLFASTSESDADWIVKLIDVYPDEVLEDPSMGGYQLPVAMDILRARYHDDPASAQAITPNEVIHYTLRLPHVAHAFLPGHRIMLQIQSSWFPLYDRNPQRFVDDIFSADPSAYVKAKHRIFRHPEMASGIELPLMLSDFSKPKS